MREASSLARTIFLQRTECVKQAQWLSRSSFDVWIAQSKLKSSNYLPSAYGVRKKDVRHALPFVSRSFSLRKATDHKEELMK